MVELCRRDGREKEHIMMKPIYALLLMPLWVLPPGCDSTPGMGTDLGTPPPDDMLVIPGPVITQVSPSRGVPAGGYDVTITGTGFGTNLASITVTFGAVPATVKSVTDTQLVVTVPPGPLGPADIVISNGTGRDGTLPAGFVYATPGLCSSDNWCFWNPTPTGNNLRAVWTADASHSFVA